MPRHAEADIPVLLADGPVAIDLLGGIEWMRCSVGQAWDGTTCTGEALHLSLVEAQEVIARLDARGDEEGSGWRLPSRDELERLVLRRETPPMIDLRIFPETLPEAYWTGEPNRFSKKNHWSVNFFTGQSYGRSFAFQPLAVRLVRERRRAPLGASGN